MASKNHLNTSLDLVKAYEKTRAGFVALAIERNRRATPFIDQARALKNVVSQVNNSTDLINIESGKHFLKLICPHIHFLLVLLLKNVWLKKYGMI